MNNEQYTNETNINSDVADVAAADAQKRVKRTKIIIISVFAVMVLIMILCFTVPMLIERSGLDGKQNSDTPKQYIFYDPYPEDFDIFKYDEYMKRGDRGFIYCNNNLEEELTDETVKDKNPGVQVMYKLIDAIKRGDEKTYNSLLSSKIEKKKSFTQQQVYAIFVTQINTLDVEANSYYFKVEYKIRENNGSFRTDIGSDMAKTQYFTVKLIGGNYLIDSITESNNK